MYNFNFFMPTKVLFGSGKLGELHSEALPGKKALITIGGQSVKKYGYLERLEKELDKYPAKLHTVLGGDLTADPLSLSDEDYLTIYRAAYK